MLLSLGHTNPSSSMVNGGGIAGSANVGDTIIPSATKDGGGIGAGVLMPLAMPTLRRRFASIMRKVKAYL